MDAKNYLDIARIVLADAQGAKSYELGIDGYQFPEPLEDKENVRWDPEYDGNWLNVSFAIKEEGRNARCKDACILSWELQHLAEDLEYFMSHPEERDYEPYFTENILYLRFHRKWNGRVRVRVEFTSEGKLSPDKKWERFRFEGVFAPKDIRRAAKALSIMSLAYPYRDFNAVGSQENDINLKKMHINNCEGEGRE